MRQATEDAIRYLSKELPDRLQAAGYDARAVAETPLGRALAGEVIRGGMTIPVFLENVEKLAIMNPNLRAKRTEITTVSVEPNRI